MLSKFLFIFRYWLCWILFFEIARLAFLLKNIADANTIGINASLLSLWYGARMDLSMAAYLTIPIALIITFSVFIRQLQHPLIFKIYTGIVLLILLLLIVIDINLFPAWGYRIDASFLKYYPIQKKYMQLLHTCPFFGYLFFLF